MSSIPAHQYFTFIFFIPLSLLFLSLSLFSLSAVCVASGIVITLMCVTLLESLQFVMQFCFTKFCIFNKEYFVFLAHQRLPVTAFTFVVSCVGDTHFMRLYTCKFSNNSNLFHLLLIVNNEKEKINQKDFFT